jgi:hypothetical protein
MDMAAYVAAKTTTGPPPTRALTPSPARQPPSPRQLAPLPGRWHFKAVTRWAVPDAALPMGGPEDPVLTPEQVGGRHAPRLETPLRIRSPGLCG